MRRTAKPLSDTRNDNPMRFRFTIRDLLWLTVVVALAVAWGMTLVENQRLRDSDIRIPTSLRDASVEKAMQLETRANALAMRH